MFDGTFGMGNILLILIAGVLIFGKDLPEVGRTVGRYLSELRQLFSGLKDLTDVRKWDPLASRVPIPSQELPHRPATHRPSDAPPFQD